MVRKTILSNASMDMINLIRNCLSIWNILIFDIGYIFMTWTTEPQLALTSFSLDISMRYTMQNYLKCFIEISGVTLTVLLYSQMHNPFSLNLWIVIMRSIADGYNHLKFTVITDIFDHYIFEVTHNNAYKYMLKMIKYLNPCLHNKILFELTKINFKWSQAQFP